MDRFERIIVVISLVFVISMVVIAQDKRDALATKIDEMIGIGHVQAELNLGAPAQSARSVWRMLPRE